MQSWRRDAFLKGFDLGDGQPALLDLRCADDILSFAKSYGETVSLLHDSVPALSPVRLILNANETAPPTNEAQPPQHLQLPSGERIAILEPIKMAGSYADGTRLQIAGIQNIFR